MDLEENLEKFLPLKRPEEFDISSFFPSLKNAVENNSKSIEHKATTRLRKSRENLKEDPECLAWTLVCTAMMRTIANIILDAVDLFCQPPKDDTVHQTTKNLERILGSNLKISSKDPHFEIEPFKNILSDWISDSVNEEEREEYTRAISNRLPLEFIFCFKEEFIKNIDKYSSLMDIIFSNSPNLTSQALTWSLYCAYLQAETNKRMFCEAFALKDIYVSPYAYYEKKENNEDATLGKKYRHVVDLKEELTTWINNFNLSEAIKVVIGDAGIGKSSFSKIFASKIVKISEIPNLRVILVPLHAFNFSSNLFDALQNFLSNSLCLSQKLSINIHNESRVLIILDGLDELKIQEHLGKQTTKELINTVVDTIKQTNDRSKKYQVLITSREATLQPHASMFDWDKQVLYMLPYYVNKEEREKIKYNDPSNLLLIDQRDEWWEKYTLAKGNKQTRPNNLKDRNFEEITTHPLLSYLFARALKDGLKVNEGISQNKIYKSLLLPVYTCEYENKRVHNTIREFQESEFMHIFEEIALIAWYGNGRTAKLKDIKNYCKQKKLEKHFEKLEESVEKGITRLFVAFYFKEIDRREKVYEFTHKSFGEYLTSLRLIRMLKSIEYYRKEHSPTWEEKSLKEIAKISGPKPIDEDLLFFIEEEISTENKDKVGQWQGILVSLINYTLVNRLPMEKLELRDFNEMLEQSKNTEKALIILLNACSAVIKKISQIKWPEATTFGTWIRHLQGQSSSPDKTSLVVKSLSYLRLSDISAYSIDLSLSCLKGTDLQLANLQLANLREADLREADLQLANLREANLKGADLRGTDLQLANLREANLKGAYLRETRLQLANLRGVELEEADLELANLQGANLQGANLQGAHLQGAHLGGVHLGEANLQGANLQGAHLQGAKIQGANLQGANLQEANLQGAYLRGAKLREANLQGANLQRSQLQEACLQEANLYQANLREADLQQACLEKANLQEVNLEEANLQKINLEEANLQKINLEKANLREANLREANLQLTRLMGAKLEKTNLEEAKLQLANLQGANLQEANLQKANLFGAKLQGANLRDANLEEANLKGAHLRGAHLQGANLELADFQQVKLQGANLQQVDLQLANLELADLQQVKLQEANLQQVNLRKANLQEANLLGAKLQLANLQKANLQLADLQKANLQLADLQQADLQEADLQQALLRDADLQGANLQGADLQQAYLLGAVVTAEQIASCKNIEHAKGLPIPLMIEIKEKKTNLMKWWTPSKTTLKLKGADLRDADLQGADLQYADLQEADLTKASLLKADLTGAELRGATLQYANLQDAQMTQADFDAIKSQLSGAQKSQITIVE